MTPITEFIMKAYLRDCSRYTPEQKNTMVNTYLVSGLSCPGIHYISQRKLSDLGKLSVRKYIKENLTSATRPGGKPSSLREWRQS